MTKSDELKLMLKAIDNKKIIDVNRAFLKLTTVELSILADAAVQMKETNLFDTIHKQATLDSLLHEVAMRN